MKINFLHVSDYALVDRTGKLSVMGIFQQIAVHQLPVVHPSLAVAFETRATGSEVGITTPLRLEIVDPDGRKLFQVEGELNNQGHPSPANVILASHVVGINGLRFQTLGPHAVNIFLAGQLAISTPIDVISIDALRPPGAEGGPGRTA
jgi:hypothetical protein